MERFVDRQADLEALEAVVRRPGAQMMALYGRRRLGKTTLLQKLGEQHPMIYWVASQLTPAQLRRDLMKEIWKFFHGNQDLDLMPNYETWRPIFQYVAEQAAGQRILLVVDELPYAVSSDPAIASELQNAWDHSIKQSNLVVIVAGSHMGMMYDLLAYQAPLYGRMTAQLHLKPLPYGALQDFFPHYSPAERVAVWGVLGGVPAYLERFSDQETVAANIRREMAGITGIFRSEAFAIINDLVREPKNYLALLRSISEGCRTPDKLATSTGIDRTHIPAYLDRLQSLGLIERRQPALIPPAQRTTAGRYHLSDALLRFFFRFVAPYMGLLERGQVALMWSQVQKQIRSFIGAGAFEELCREWVWLGQSIPFVPQEVGAYWQVQPRKRRAAIGSPLENADEEAPADEQDDWLDQHPGAGPADEPVEEAVLDEAPVPPAGAGVQIDVAAVNWDVPAVLLGECKWAPRKIGRSVLTDLLENKGPKVLQTLPERGAGWTAHYALFSRAGFTAATQQLAAAQGVILVDLNRLDRDLCRAVQPVPGRRPAGR